MVVEEAWKAALVGVMEVSWGKETSEQRSEGSEGARQRDRCNALRLACASWRSVRKGNRVKGYRGGDED